MRVTTFADRLIQRINELDISAADLSRKIGISEAVISQYKSGKYEPKQDRLEIFAKALNVSEAWLMGYDVEKSPMPQEKIDDHLSPKSDKSADNNAEISDPKILLLARHLSEIPDETRAKVISTFEDTIDIYLAAMRDKKED